jgi:RIO-like serine/threonine protein kinase
MSCEDAKEYLESMGFSIIGKGRESVVYSKKGFEYVIKLQTWQKTKRVLCDKHFANQVTFNSDSFNVIVQEKCEKFELPYPYIETSKPYKKWQKFKLFIEKKFDVGDLYDFNMGLRNGKLVSIDWNHWD